MVEKFIPDIYQKSIYYINYDKLYKKGIRCLLFDLDNTIVPSHTNKPTKRLKKLFDELKDKGFTRIPQEKELPKTGATTVALIVLAVVAIGTISLIRYKNIEIK